MYTLSEDKSKQPQTSITVKGLPVTVVIDSGASTNVIDEVTYDKLKSSVSLTKPKSKLYGYRSDKPLPVLSKFKASAKSSQGEIDTEFYVTKGNSGCLLGYCCATGIS